MEWDLEKKYSSYKALDEAVELFSKKHKIHLYKRDTKTLQTYAKRKKFSNANPDLIYYLVIYACVHGGRSFIRSKNSKLERKTKTMKTGCPFFIYFVLSKDCQFLELFKMNNTHNHPIDENLFELHPRARRLPEDTQKLVCYLMNQRVDKKALQEQIKIETGKTVLMKDLHNIASRFKEPEATLDIAAYKLKKEYSCRVSVFQEKGITRNVFFQDQKMAEAYRYYPEILILDDTYKLPEFELTCVVFLIENGNGENEIVGIGLLHQVHTSSVQWLIENFLIKNKDSHKTKIIMTSKFPERDILKDKFPNAELLLCKCHVLKVFDCEVTAEKMNIEPEQAEKAKEFLSKMCYSESEEEYWDLYEKFTSTSPKPVVDYFNENWHLTYKEWTHMVSLSDSFSDFTNNGLDSFSSKLKTFIKPYSSMSSFIDKFFVNLNALREIKGQYFNSNLEVQISVKLLNSTILAFEYNELLMPLPFKYIVKQLNAATPDLLMEVASLYYFSSRGTLYPVNCTACSCQAFNSLKLPCRHVFSVRILTKAPLYDSEIVDKRWTKKYLLELQNTVCTDLHEEDSSEKEEIQPPPRDIIAENKKELKLKNKRYRKALGLARELAEIASQSSESDFNQKMELLQQIKENWKNNQVVCFPTNDSAENV